MQIKQDSKYQLEEILDWVVHFKHLQAVLKEFDLAVVYNKEILIYYFRKKLHPSIQMQLNYWGYYLDACDKVVEKTGDVKAKANL